MVLLIKEVHAVVFAIVFVVVLAIAQATAHADVAAPAPIPAPAGDEHASALLAMYGLPVLNREDEGKKLAAIEQHYQAEAQRFYNGTMLSAAHELAQRNDANALAQLDEDIGALSDLLFELERLTYGARMREVPYIMELDVRYRETAAKLEVKRAAREKLLAQPRSTTADDVDHAAREQERRSLYTLAERVQQQRARYDESLSYPILGEVTSFRSPLDRQAEVTSSFGMRADPFLDGVLSFHSGIDLRAEEGTPVLAAFHGVVEEAEAHPDLGYYIVLDHGRGIRTVYGHLSDFMVTPGQQIKQYEMIAASGNTGARTTGPHLHFGLTINGRTVDPAVLMRLQEVNE